MKDILFTLFKWGLIGVIVYACFRACAHAMAQAPYEWWHGILDTAAIVIIVVVNRVTRRWMGLEP